MLENLNYDPEDVQTGKAYIASIAGSGVAFGFLIVGIGEPPQTGKRPKPRRRGSFAAPGTFWHGAVRWRRCTGPAR